MKKLAKFGIVTLLIVGLVASVFAFSGQGFTNEAARAALETGDYAKWKEAVTSELTEERFNQLSERYKQKAEKRAEITQAMQEGYEAWKEAIADSPIGNRITEVVNKENFDTFVEMHEAMQDSDYETAKELAEELGLEDIRYDGRGKGFIHRMPLK